MNKIYSLLGIGLLSAAENGVRPGDSGERIRSWTDL